MEIAKGITSDDYRKLDLTSYTNPDWETAFDYLDRRLTERYIEPIEVLRNYEENKPASEKKFGFTVFAIDCLLIETIQSFYEGETDSSGKSTGLFQRFLMQRDNFKAFFKTESFAIDFYKNFRCGIIHQAQTLGDTKIWATGKMVFELDEFIIVNREIFHEAVVKEKDIYLSQLIKGMDNKLLDNFRKKMDFIASA